MLVIETRKTSNAEHTVNWFLFGYKPIRINKSIPKGYLKVFDESHLHNGAIQRRDNKNDN